MRYFTKSYLKVALAVCIVALLLSCGESGPKCKGDGTLNIAGRHSTGYEPNAVVSGDFDQDDQLDVAFLEEYGHTLYVLLGTGDGLFAASDDHQTSEWPSDVASGKFDVDDYLDLVVVEGGIDSVKIFLGNGDGTFTAGGNYPTGSYSNNVATGDFDGDGIIDLALADGYDMEIQLLLGNGDGSFRPGPTSNAGTGPSELAAVDFDKDGILDMAVIGDSGVMVLTGNGENGRGDGTFSATTDYFMGGFEVYDLATGDFDGNGFDDILVTYGDPSSIGICLCDGDDDWDTGLFGEVIEFPLDKIPARLVAGDFDYDGHLDVVTTWFNEEYVSVYLGQGSGDPAALFSGVVDNQTDLDEINESLRQPLPVDLNNDGVLDLVLTVHGGGGGHVLSMLGNNICAE